MLFGRSSNCPEPLHVRGNCTSSWADLSICNTDHERSRGYIHSSRACSQGRSKNYSMRCAPSRTVRDPCCARGWSNTCCQSGQGWWNPSSTSVLSSPSPRLLLADQDMPLEAPRPWRRSSVDLARGTRGPPPKSSVHARWCARLMDT